MEQYLYLLKWTYLPDFIIMEEFMLNAKIIGTGNTAVVYEYQGKALKLFKENYPREAALKEFNNAKAIHNMDFSKPKAYEIISFENRIGIIYERIEGQSLLDLVMKTSNINQCAIYMAELHKKILNNKISTVLNYKEFLKFNIINSKSADFDKQKRILKILSDLPDGDTLCHGDFHPGNIFVSDDHTTAIDFMNVCQGTPLYDIARTVFLIQYTPLPEGTKNVSSMLELKKSLADSYLIHMNVTREIIQNYLLIISAARRGECPNE